MPKYLVVDTNIILLDANNLITLAKEYPDYRICLPETVIEELDSKKTALGDLGYQARSFGRMVAKGTKLSTPTDNLTVLSLAEYKLEDLNIYIASTDYYPTDEGVSPKLVNDSRIIYIATALNAKLVSNDVMCRIRGESKGLDVSDFKSVSQVDLEFTKIFEVTSNIFNNIHNTDIALVDPTYEPLNFSYMFYNVQTGETKLATIHNKMVKILGKDSERDLRNQYVNPCNKEQLIMSALIQDPTTDVTIIEALAGSGKTLLAVSNAIKLVDSSTNKLDSIIYIRNSVDDISNPDEAIGFLKGNDEKLAVYLQPFYDTVGQIVRSTISSPLKGKALEEFVEQEVNQFVDKYNMSAMIALGLRGRTFDNSVIIIDEAQNISKGTMQKILSRVGKNSKVIVIGSLRQIDSAYLTKYTSGLSVLLDATTRTDLPIKLNAVTLRKVVRGPITEFSEMVFSNTKET